MNAVIEVRVPLDLPVDASKEEKGDAVAKIMERVFEHADSNWVGAGRWEIVEDGEPV